MNLTDTITGVGTTEAITLTAPSTSCSPIMLKLDASDTLTLKGLSITATTIKLGAPDPLSLTGLHRRAA